MNAWAVPTAIKCGKYLCLPLRYFSHRGVKFGLSSALSPIFGSRHRRLVVDRVQHPHRGVKFGLSSVHSPSFGSRHCRLVGLDGLEPSTSRLSGARSNHLSYRPLFRWSFVLCPSSFSQHFCTKPQGSAAKMVEMMGIEPMTPCLQGRCSPS